MPLAPENYQALDDALNRLASESILATPGRDEGLIPAYSLLGEILALCESEPVLHAAIKSTHTTLDKLLDVAQPFNESTIVQLRKLIDWLPEAIEAVKAGKEPDDFGASVAPIATLLAAIGIRPRRNRRIRASLGGPETRGPSVTMDCPPTAAKGKTA